MQNCGGFDFLDLLLLLLELFLKLNLHFMFFEVTFSQLSQQFRLSPLQVLNFSVQLLSHVVQTCDSLRKRVYLALELILLLAQQFFCSNLYTHLGPFEFCSD
jgi:hypothetical protein